MSPKAWTPRRVKDEEERRKYATEFISLDEGERMTAYALFTGDPKEDEPGYYEYWQHFDPSIGRKGGTVPCAGEDDCVYCEDGDRPRPTAKAMFAVTRYQGDEFDPPELRSMDLRPNLIKQFTELRAEGDKIKGQLFRISRIDDRTWSIQPKAGQSIPAKEVKEHLKDAPDLEQGLIARMKSQMQRQLTAKAMSEDDEPETPKAKPDEDGAKPKGKTKDTSEEFPASHDELEVTVAEVDEGNTLMVTHEDYNDGDPVKVWGTENIDVTEFEEGDTITISYFTDNEDDLVLDADPDKAEAGGEGSGDLPDKIEEEPFVVKAVNAGQSTIDVESDELGLEFTLYFLDSGPGSEVDFEDYSEGDKIIVTAEKDNEDDMVATAVPEKVKAKGGKGGKKKGGK